MLDEVKLGTIIEDLAAEVETINCSYIDLGNGALKEEGEPVSLLNRICAEEYAYSGRLHTYGGKKLNMDKHSLCLKVLAGIISRMPSGRCRLYWREKPLWEEYKDLDTKDTMGSLYCRLGWWQLDG